MATKTVRIRVHEGWIEPLEEFPLPPGSEGSVTVADVGEELVSAPKALETLFGALPELAAITDEDVADAKKLWGCAADKQAAHISGNDK
jgi:hypothetical protein